MIWSIIKEYGIGWLICRTLYSAKLVFLRKAPVIEKLFEKKVKVKRLDILRDNSEEIAKALDGLPQELKDALILDADKAANGIIKGFSSLEMCYGEPINWQLSPLTGKECDKNVKWYRIPDFDAERGDIKAVWEISRFSHFITLARAFLLTKDRKYYDAFSAQLSSWLEENPYSYGANYKCGQECALRMMNALLAYNIFSSAGIASEEDKENLAELVGRCYRKILSNFFYAYRCIKNNHTISELAGMIIGAWCSCDEKRLKKAYKMLDKVIAEQFLPDGGYRQYSFNYQRLALQDLEYVLSIFDRTGICLSERSIDRLKKSVMLMYECQDESGDMPNYGSNDGALVFPVTSCSYRDFRPVIGALYAMLFKKRLYPKGIYDEEYLWFGGDMPTEPADIKRQSAKFPESGLFTIRSGGSWMMTVLNDYTSRPAHMDQLHIDLWKDGINILCDSGTYSYASEKGAALILTGAHNTVKADGIEQMTKRGTFMIYNRTKRCEVSAEDTEFIGEMKSVNGYSHQREITACDGGYVICDTVTAPADTKYKILFHTPCRTELENGKIILFDGERQVCTIEGTLNYEVRNSIRSLYYLTDEPVSEIAFCGIVAGMSESTIKISI